MAAQSPSFYLLLCFSQNLTVHEVSYAQALTKSARQLRVELKEKICVGFGIGYVICDQDRVRVELMLRGLEKVLNVVANRFVGQQFSEL